MLDTSSLRSISLVQICDEEEDNSLVSLQDWISEGRTGVTATTDMEEQVTSDIVSIISELNGNLQ